MKRYSSVNLSNYYFHSGGGLDSIYQVAVLLIDSGKQLILMNGRKKSYQKLNKKKAVAQRTAKTIVTLDIMQVPEKLKNGLLKFDRVYFVLAVLILVAEINIAVFAHDRIIRPYVGDVLVVILIYCTVKSFFDSPVLSTALSVLAFSFVIESLQYLNVVHRLGLQDSQIATTIIGTSFAWIDIFAYIMGILIVLVCEKIIQIRNAKEAN